MSEQNDKETLSLIKDLADDLNKTFKNTVDQVAYVITNASDTPFRVRDWVPTGSDTLDIAISNRPYGGLPTGRIVEIAGLEATGKSVLAAHLVSSTQAAGGLAVYYDTENAYSEEFFKSIGVDVTRMVYVPMQCIEDIFLSIERNIDVVRKASKDKIVTIIVDSVMGASTKNEMSSEYDKDGYATSKSIILSKAMRKITNLIGREKILLVLTNQLRVKMGVSFGDPYTTSGGKAIPFHASVRIRLKNIGKIKKKIDGIDVQVGIRVRAEIHKNRMGAPAKKVTYDLYFNRGIDNYGGWLYTMKEHKIVKTAGAWYKFDFINKETGEIEDIKFQSKEFEQLIKDRPDVKEDMYLKMCEKLINTYDAESPTDIDSITIDTGIEEDD